MKLEVPAFTTVVTRLDIALALRAVYTEGTVVMTTKVSNAEKCQNAFIKGPVFNDNLRNLYFILWNEVYKQNTINNS